MNAENCIKCDECIFKCGNEWEMVRHMSKEHEEILKKHCSCDACGTCFGTRYLLKVHNKKEHNIDVIAKVSSAEESEMDDHECQQCPLKCTPSNELHEHIKERHDRKITKKKQKNKKK